MQVMQSNEFEKTEVLVGQVQATQNFGVSDDPMLMSMLSTGFYGNPLRTMIQEIMFNAWDAHRMGNCLDKPIDIYINEGTGLIIRDYGPGIPDDEIHGVYCIYGASTKRGDKRQTGGFGLGSKSPFAYSESFTVTSMNQHMKCMYLISRVSDDGGKPGLTRLIKIDTTETGLMVTVPIEVKDRFAAKKYIRDVLFLSGIKANFHYMDEPEELIESISLKPGEYHIAEDSSTITRGIYAVYGGVRYSIPEHEDYTSEMLFLSQISQNTSLFIGFAADTLTPLPNREGLNMSLKCRENVRAGLELCIERFKVILTPLVHAFFRECFEAHIKTGIQAQFAIYNAASRKELPINMTEFVKKYLPLTPTNVDPSMWKVGLRMLNHYRQNLIQAFGEERWMTILAYQFCLAYPDSKSLGFAVGKLPKHFSVRALNEVISKHQMPAFAKDLYDFEVELKAAYSDDDSLHATLRYMTGNSIFSKISRQKVRVSQKSDKHKKSVPQFEDPYVLYDNKNLEPLNRVFTSKTILLAKTTQCFSNTQISQKSYFSNKWVNEYNYVLTEDSHLPLMCCVVYNRKGAYQKAKEILLAKGYNVIEAAEPEKIVRTKVEGDPVKTVPTYPTLKWHSRVQWKAPGDEEEENPTHMLYCLQSTIQDDGYYNQNDKPSFDLIELVTSYYPKTVLIQNVKQAQLLKDRGVIEFKDAVQTIFDKIQTKKYRFRNIVRAITIKKGSQIPMEMLKDPIIQKAMGMVVVEDTDESFWKETAVYQTICGSSYHLVATTKDAANKLIKTTFDADPMKAKIEEAIKITSLFGESGLRHKWHLMKPEDRPDFAKRISKFIAGN